MEKGGLKLKLKIGSTPEPPIIEDSNTDAPADMQEGEAAVEEDLQPQAALAEDTAREKQHRKSKKKKRKREREKDRHRHKRERWEQEGVGSEGSGGGCLVSGEAEEAPSPAAVAAALTELLSYLLKQIEKRDSNLFFMSPVTDLIAPGYSSIISEPMCFVSMRDKVVRGLYSSLQQFEDDVKLIVANCLKYNGPDTVYYNAGKKLLSGTQSLLSRDKLRALRREIPSIGVLDQDTLGLLLDDCDGGESGGDDRTDSPNSHDSRSECDDGDDSEEEAAIIAEQASQAARVAATALHNNKPTTTMGYLKPRPDGSVGLKFLSGCSGSEAPDDSKPLNIGLVLGKLTAGSATLHNYHDDKRTMAKPVKPIHYGSYSSFCPSYDSTFANLSKEESDLVRATYGNETAVQYSESICEFSRDCSMATTLVDQLLNLLTSGQHSRTRTTIAAQQQHRQLQQQQLLQDDKKDVKPFAAAAADISNLRSLSALGIDTSFLDTFEQLQQQSSSAASQLSSTAELVQSLAAEQSERLSKQPSQSNALLPTHPTQAELQLAERLTSELVSVARQLPPSALLPAPLH